MPATQNQPMARRPVTFERIVRYAKRKARAFYGKTLWHAVGPIKRRVVLNRRGLRVHLGCGDDRFAGFLNIDERFTPATDVTMNLSRPAFQAGSVSACFSHAFYEHLFVRDRVPHLRAIREALEPGGVICYLGLPDFRNIARFYLEKRPGIVGDVFDLFNVYRYTHGDPERVPWFVGQLHKGLFDYEEVVHLLKDAGFEHFVVISSCYGDEKLPVNLGFYAVKGPAGDRNLKEECLEFIRPYAGYKVNMETVKFLEG